MKFNTMMHMICKLPLNTWPAILILGWLVLGCRPEPPAESARMISEMNRGVSLMGQYLYEEAVQAFEAALREAPDLTEVRINLAIARFNRNGKEDIEAATELLEGVLQQEPDNLRALYFQAIVLQHLGRAEQAVTALERVVQGRPEDGAAWYLLALCKQRLSRPAESDFRETVQHRPYFTAPISSFIKSPCAPGKKPGWPVAHHRS